MTGSAPGGAPLAADALRRPLPGAGVAAFCADLVRIPSPSGEEERAVRRVVQEMRALGFDEADVDAAGNAVGVIRSRHPQRKDACLVLDSHLDCVDEGDPAAWEHGPFSGVTRDGRLHGRGATDAKSCVAAQVHAAATLRVLRDEGTVGLRHDVVVAAVVQEEVGGLGSAFLAGQIRPAAAVIGEPSLGHLAFGHRGRIETEMLFHGIAGHASRPDRARSPHPSAARFVLGLDGLPHARAHRLGASTAAITQVRASPRSVNVIPDELALIVDWRHVPSESPEHVREALLDLARAGADEGIGVEARVPVAELVSWTGLRRPMRRITEPFATDPDGALFTRALATLRSGLGRDVSAMPWDFASDGGWLQAAGATCIGYGPGDLAAMHVRDESVAIDLVEEAVMGNLLLICALDESLSRGEA